MSKVVLIDDEELVTATLTRVLEHVGHETVCFDDAEPALRQIEFDSVDLVVVDLAMPTPGETVIQTLRNRGLDLPIIVLTGILEHKDMERLMAMGATRVLEKPLQMTPFLAVVDLLLSGTDDSLAPSEVPASRPT